MSVPVEEHVPTRRRPEEGASGQRASGRRRAVRRTSQAALRRPPAGVRVAGRPRMRPTSCAIARPRPGWRLLVLLTAGAFAAMVLLGSMIGGLAGAAHGVPERTALVTVEPGQSLWDIATTYAPASDPRAVVERIEELNDLTAGALPTGYPLSVPIQSRS